MRHENSKDRGMTTVRAWHMTTVRIEEWQQ